MKRKVARSHTKKCRSGKTRFRDHESAITALSITKRMSTREKVSVRVYECDECKGWHFTSKKQ